MLKPAFVVAGTIVALGIALSPAAGQSPPPPGGDVYIEPEPPPLDPVVKTPSLFDALAAGDVSPLGTSPTSVDPVKMIDEANAFLHGNNGHPKNAREGTYWLARAILVPETSPARRAWSIMRLGLAYAQGERETSPVLARQLWEIAGAMGSPEALCNLGLLSERGDKVNKPDPQQALTWYERAKKAGCEKADEAIARLKK
ncbi:MAG: sel1 repeat family protein [Methylobacteriaceae bacterium]|nr:sel1 repeat family protein [Methylobacteriaceae bacterium]